MTPPDSPAAPADPSTATPDTAAAPPPQAPAEGKHPRRKLAVAGLMIGMLLGALDNTIVATVLTNISTDLGATGNQAFLVSAYLIAQTIAMPVFGKLSDHFGRRFFFLLGLAVLIVGAILSGLAQNFSQLLLCRAVQGVGSGAFFPVANAIIGVMFGPRERARLSGAFAATFGIASVMGPLAGSAIVAVSTWRWIFYINLPLGFVSLAVVWTAIGPLRGESKSKFDWPGAALLGGWVAAFMLVLEETGTPGGWKWTDPSAIGLLGLGAALFGGFIWWEGKAQDPVLPLRFFKIRVVSATSAVSFLRGFVMITTLTMVSILVGTLTLGSADAVRNTLYGLLLPMVVGASIGGVLLPRTGYRPMMAGGMIVMTLGAALMTLISITTPTFVGWEGGFPSGMFLFLMPVGFGIGMTFAPAVLVVQYAVPRKDIGVSTSMVQFLMNIGGAFGVSILGSYQAARVASMLPPGLAPNTPAYFAALPGPTAVAMHEVFLIMFAVAALAIVPALWVKGHLPQNQPPSDGAPITAA